MIDLTPDHDDPMPRAARDGVGALDADSPRIVSISDIHGYLDAARAALTVVGDHPDFAPLVDADEDGRLHWAGDDESVLVFNGDLVDRGPDNAAVVALVERLAREAPPGHVRVTLGNHEWGVLFRDLVNWDAWFSGSRSDVERRQLCEAIVDGHLVAAYDGYAFTYAHAGRVSDYDTARLNDRFAEAAGDLLDAIGTDDDESTQKRLVEDYREVLGIGRRGGRAFGAGIAWLDFKFLSDTAPLQVVGHTRQDEIVQKGNVICENVIRANLENAGGEAVMVETESELVALERRGNGSVRKRTFEIPDGD
ncbi:metallophosphoesterase [Halosimplex litoreum]|uniref:Metallophosphoesterase n=1 Tax=Halosimplex litoreum TaxID=1198301 RepID=A0A7T3FYV0_9EURY|nr:metallophosphoesterase [Halosimplex litoreum]QPV63176.1 metallophosphoesterase [Halosimplex litoreum]